MAEFIYKDYSCELCFGDKKYELPLNETTADLITKHLYGKTLPENVNGIEEIEAFYDEIMDAIDEILGEGAADDIMSRFKHPGIMELFSVVNFITTEWNTQYSAIVDNMKQTAQLPNRETRRARAKR